MAQIFEFVSESLKNIIGKGKNKKKKKKTRLTTMGTFPMVVFFFYLVSLKFGITWTVNLPSAVAVCQGKSGQTVFVVSTLPTTNA